METRKFDPVALSSQSTVVAEYVPEGNDASGYQSEAQLEAEFIHQLQAQGYEYADIRDEQHLETNLRAQLSKLNDVEFTDAEWNRFYKTNIANSSDTVEDKTTRIQEDHIQLLEREDGTTKNIRLIDKDNIHNNHLQVINQYAVDKADGAKHSNRYDVTILVNGLPLAHIELKRRGVPLREAFNQINRYRDESFSTGAALFDYAQIFVISNGTSTKYYSNTTRLAHVNETNKKDKKSFVFTSYWADAQNQPIEDLIAFAKTFFAKRTILNILTKYCVYTENRQLLVMRPYQIVATERILTRILTSTNAGTLGTTAAGGYIWHTTGSGKTLTSFKTAQLATKVEGVEKVLFVVDRKDLDYQTKLEYDRFQKGAANGNTSTAQLKRQLESTDPAKKIIVTTIQKLATFIKANQGHTVYNGHVVLIFDECHRSQFGDMHVAIKRAFKKYNLFGFTGTPIFAENAGYGKHVNLKTTAQAFGEKLHTYTIVDAITDKNVLPFRIDYINTIEEGSFKDKDVRAIDVESAMMHPERIRQVAQYILDHFDQKTKRNSVYMVGGKRKQGFNALFATSSIEAARAYYGMFSKLQLHLPDEKKLKIGMIYSYGANDQPEDGIIEDESFDAEKLSESDRGYLEDVINDYNDMFSTNFDTSGSSFQDYYEHLSKQLKDRELDLVIVVNMFLTGFDAPTLNTLFVDKNLRSHGLIQAYSRTNRILNTVKTYGNIVSFRNLEQQTQDAIALFGNKDASGIVMLRPYQEYLDEYQAKLDELRGVYADPTNPIPASETAQKKFINIFGAVLRLQNILSSFDDFEGDNQFSERELQDYKSRYMDLYDQWKPRTDNDREDIRQDVLFEIELVKQVEINVDYILMLVEQRHEAGTDSEDKEIRAKIDRALSSSPSLRPKRKLIEEFVDTVSINTSVQDEWREYVNGKRQEELTAIINEERLNRDKAEQLISNALRSGHVPTAGQSVASVLPPISRFRPDNARGATMQRVYAKLQEFVDRFRPLLRSDFED
ncbi:MAG: type I restriction endonuclease subunit R [Actinomyces sp.]|uniref:type I restriction endonuclease subunit R n=1 Tax=Actinomycetaceae TaxID=2049 RepID=UPI0008A2E119|nr:MULTISPECIES: type I restriction endonuclease subunit R [Actinomycetaceae]MDK7144026.1 type I restriction endonuclease subunit R [Gleimia europaea]MDU4831844.1 type I restriction endonuclease subunit R [Actinomyces sp.]OFJ61599.1 DEAD/DEAH box helicase [Actinomyces sp. HMSC075B09]